MHKYIRQMGSTPEAVTAGAQVEDLVVLPPAAFGCNFHYWTKENNESFVYHMFNNSWSVTPACCGVDQQLWPLGACRDVCWAHAHPACHMTQSSACWTLFEWGRAAVFSAGRGAQKPAVE